MGIIADMDAQFIASRPLPKGATWLIGRDVWHALMADLTRIYRDRPFPPFNPKRPPEELFGAPLRHVRTMMGWSLAIALDCEADQEQESEIQGVDTQ